MFKFLCRSTQPKMGFEFNILRGRRSPLFAESEILAQVDEGLVIGFKL
ncbi:MAG: hypothetical protein O4859_31410 [Trichodesmium sp. St18_bin1]|nr:hypothetical protein [Trichodesmium sp. St18_bin1]MDE5124291.1 hypothetical protein [Trichodesmium sp. St19_bin1]